MPCPPSRRSAGSGRRPGRGRRAVRGADGRSPHRGGPPPAPVAGLRRARGRRRRPDDRRGARRDPAVSPAAVSGAVNFLGQIGFLHREREPGSRKDVYVVDDDAWLGAMMRRDQTYAPMMTALATALEGLGSGAPAPHRLWLMREFLVFVDDEMDGLAERWLARRRDLEEGGAGAAGVARSTIPRPLGAVRRTRRHAARRADLTPPRRYVSPARHRCRATGARCPRRSRVASTCRSRVAARVPARLAAGRLHGRPRR